MLFLGGGVKHAPYTAVRVLVPEQRVATLLPETATFYYAASRGRPSLASYPPSAQPVTPPRTW